MKDLDIRALAEQEIPNEPCPPIEHEFRVVIQQDAFDKIVSQAHKDTTVEVGGVLVGRLLKDDGGPYLIVDDIIDATQALETRTEFTLTHDSWEHINKQMDRDHVDRRIIGWYHTHPGFGIFLSDQDVFIHKSFFNLPFQVALVYDPTNRTHGCFSWQKGELKRLRCYWIGRLAHLSETEKESVPPKRNSRIPISDEPARSVSSAPAPMQQPHREAAEHRENSSGNFKNYLHYFVLLFILGGIGGYFLCAFRIRDDLLQIEGHLEQARLDGVRETVNALRSDLLLTFNAVADREAVDPLISEVIKILSEAHLQSGAHFPANDTRQNADPEADSPDANILAADLVRARSGMKKALDKMVELGTLRYKSQRLLTVLSAEETTKSRDLKKIEREGAQNRVYLGQLFADVAEIAAKSGETKRAKRLFSAASMIDPQNRNQYEARSTATLPGGNPPPAQTESEKDKSDETRAPGAATDLTSTNGAVP